MSREEPVEDFSEIVEMIKRGESIKNLKKYFSANNGKFSRMHLMNGYSDPEYRTRFSQMVHWLPLDDTMQTIIGSDSTQDWNPIIFAIFYKR